MKAQKTTMWCPTCMGYNPCPAKPLSKMDESPERLIEIDSSIYAFRRGRECTNCGCEFTTLEIDEYEIDRLFRISRAFRTMAPVVTALVEKVLAFVEAVTPMLNLIKEVLSEEKQRRLADIEIDKMRHRRALE